MEKIKIEDLDVKEQRFLRMISLYKGSVLPAYVFLIGITESVIFFFKMADVDILRKMSFLFFLKDSEYSVYLFLYLILIFLAGFLVRKISRNPERSNLQFMLCATIPFYVAGFFMIMIDFSILCIDDHVMMKNGKIFLLDYIFCKGLVFIFAWKEWSTYGNIIYENIRDFMASKKQAMNGQDVD